MAVVRYPFRVKQKGAWYAPGEEIETDTPEEYVAQGAELVSPPAHKETTEEPEHHTEEKPRRGRPKKSE